MIHIALKYEQGESSPILSPVPDQQDDAELLNLLVFNFLTCLTHNVTNFSGCHVYISSTHFFFLLWSRFISIMKQLLLDA